VHSPPRTSRSHQTDGERSHKQAMPGTTHPVVGIVLHAQRAGGRDLHHRRLALEQAARPRPLHLPRLPIQQRQQAADVARLARCAQGRKWSAVVGAQLEAAGARCWCGLAMCGADGAVQVRMPLASVAKVSPVCTWMVTCWLTCASDIIHKSIFAPSYIQHAWQLMDKVPHRCARGW